ncbi:MAG: response regulator transcription factor [Magnetospiraceae bacterium]
MTTKGLVFILEDERDVSDLITLALTDHGYSVETFRTGAAALQRLSKKKPDVCLVDLMLPDMDGLEIVRSLDETPEVGVIILTGRGDLSDRVLGLEIGADDYLVKPFEPRELVARVNSLVRRLVRIRDIAAPQDSRRAFFAGWTFDTGALTLQSRDGRSESVSSAEAQLLLALLRAPNRVLSRDQLLDSHGFEDHQPFDRSIDVRVSRLRKKLEKDAKTPKIIKTIYGVGYLLASQVEWVER